MTPIISEGLNLAIVGMGTVFVFLSALVFATMGMSYLVALMEPQTTPDLSGGRTAMSGKQTAMSEKKKMAAITAAIHQHRNRQ